MRAFIRVMAMVPVLLALGLAGRVWAVEARTPGGPPALVVQAPDGADVHAEGGNLFIYPVKDAMPFLMLTLAAADVKGADLAAPGHADQLAATVFSGFGTTAGGAISAPVAAGKTTIDGRSAYLYRGQKKDADGGTMDMGLAILPIDDGHLAFLVLIGKLGAPDTSALEQVMWAAKVVDR
jgi:hypothetical protein